MINAITMRPALAALCLKKRRATIRNSVLAATGRIGVGLSPASASSLSTPTKLAISSSVAGTPAAGNFSISLSKS